MHWKKLAILGTKPIFIPSMIILSLTPLGAALLHDQGIKYFTNPKDTENIVLPFNIILLYWSSFCFFVGQCIFSLYCPDIISHYKKYRDWRENSPEASAKFEALLIDKGDVNIEHIEIFLISNYHSLIVEKSKSNSTTRWITTLFYFLGLILFFIVMIKQVILIYKFTF